MRTACRLFSRGVIFTRARVLLALLSLRKNRGLRVVYRCSCPFRKRSLPFLRHLENFSPVIGSVSIKTKENRIPGSNLDLEPRPFVSSSLSLTTVPQLEQCPRHFNLLRLLSEGNDYIDLPDLITKIS